MRAHTCLPNSLLCCLPCDLPSSLLVKLIKGLLAIHQEAVQLLEAIK